MALNKVQLKADIKQALVDEMGSYLTAEQTTAFDRWAGKIADAIDTYVKTATVNVTSVSGVTPGIGVSGPGTGTLS